METLILEEQYLTFAAAGEVFAIGVLALRQILQRCQIVKVPTPFEFIRGFTRLGDRVVPVLDVAARFGCRRSVIDNRSCVLIADIKWRGACREIGLLVDRVDTVVEVTDDDIARLPSFDGDSADSHLISGTANTANGGHVTLLNIDHALSREEVAAISPLVDRIEAGLTPSSGSCGSAY